MATFSRPAVQVIQGNLTLYLTYVTPRDLFTSNFYEVDALEASSQEGFQRILHKPRATRLSRHLTQANNLGYAHLPTTVFLATSESIQFDEASGTLEFDKEIVCPFSVVDGQHRIEGLRQAVETDGDLKDFQLPVTIATNLDVTHQMYHFFMVNTTQVPVEASLRQQITKRFTNMQGVEDLPYTPFWLQREINKGQDDKALRITEFLNSQSRSPLAGRIQMANEPASRNKIKQSSFVNVLKGQVLSAANPLAGQETDIEMQSKIMLNYFLAIDDIFVAGRERTATVVYKSNGLFFFLGISKWVFSAIYSSDRNFTVKSISAIVTSALEHLEDDASRTLPDPDWWMPGPVGASALNRSAATHYIGEFQRALAQSRASQGIQI